jgi:hypothetical protein
MSEEDDTEHGSEEEAGDGHTARLVTVVHAPNFHAIQFVRGGFAVG